MSDTQIFLITIVIRWASGLGVSLALGPSLIGIILNKLRSSIREKAPEKEQTWDPTLTEKLYIDNRLVGILERFFFTVMVAFRIPGTGAAMGLWITVKMLYNWGMFRDLKEDARPNAFIRSMMFSALLGNALSMLFATIGGLICN